MAAAKNNQSTTVTEPEAQQEASGEKKDAVQETGAGAIPSSYHTIEELKAQLGTPTPVFTGMCAYHGWNPGKMVTAEEYFQALKDFGGAPMGRRKTT